MITHSEGSMPPERVSAFGRISALEKLVRDLRLNLINVETERRRTVELLRYVVYQRLPLGETVLERLDDSRQATILNLLHSIDEEHKS